MTKKTGLFEVNIDLDSIMVIPEQTVKQRINSRTIDDASGIIIHQMTASGYRHRTIKDYEIIIRSFKKVHDVQYLSDITLNTIYGWLEQMHVSNQTKLTRLKALKSFLSKCFNNGWYETKFWQMVTVKVDKKVKKGADEKDIQILLSLLDLNTFIGLRDAVAILTMYKTGIRINTLGQLEEKHIDFNNMVINIDGAILKNHQFLKLPLDNQLLKLLRILIQQNQKIRNHYNEQNKCVFISTKGTSLNTKSTNNAISKQLTKYSKRFGLTNINAHALRRAYAKDLLNKGASVALISKALGHSDLGVTAQYLDLDVEEVATSLRDFL
ncbi:site-specific integrase [Psychrobacillus sp.]|uniref:tyrosine-type recombinase/integrase n=1 Tax=Psychrobacillus sp. TaxID=1871623 RepID=UPI0028BDB180|nr:site-specific integrase [Psychrobacillus sp.]